MATRTILTIDEVAAQIGRSPETLRYWRNRARGEGPRSFRLGRRVVYDQADVNAWIEQSRESDPLGAA